MSKKDQLIEITEKIIRERGYNGFSIKDIANLAGIKTSSVHYYFPEKKDLGIEVTQKYTENFMEIVSKIDTSKELKTVLKKYIQIFEESYVKDKQLCLCAVLASERGSIPEEVSEESKNFFQENLNWLSEVISDKSNLNGHEKALFVLSTLEGALLISNSFSDTKYFKIISRNLLESFK